MAHALKDDYSIELRPETTRFVELVARGYDPADAAQLAGYERGEARQLIRHPAITEALRKECRALAHGRLLPLATRALARVLEDPTTPPVLLARIAAQLIASAGMLSPHAADAPKETEENSKIRDITSMTPEQLSAAKRDLNRLLTIEGSPVKANVQ